MVATKKSTGKVASKTPAKKPADTAKKPVAESKVVPRKRTAKKPSVEQRLKNLEDNSANAVSLDIVDNMFVKKDDLDSAISNALSQGDDVADAVRNCIQNDSDIVTSANVDDHIGENNVLAAVCRDVKSLSTTVDGLKKHRTWLWVGIIVLFLFASVAVLSPRSFDPVRDVMSLNDGSL